MAENTPHKLSEPPSVAALSIASTATTEVSKAKEQVIDPWSVEAATDEQGNILAFDYAAISAYGLIVRTIAVYFARAKIFGSGNGIQISSMTRHLLGSSV
jgi:hypothetical protein